MKLRSYARAGIPQYWIVNLRDRQIEVYSQPTTVGGTTHYEQMLAYPAGESISLNLAGTVPFDLAVSDILPQPSPS